MQCFESHFPPEWSELCGARFAWYSGSSEQADIWNVANPVVRLLKRGNNSAQQDILEGDFDPLPYRDQILSNRAAAASWILRCISAGQSKLYDGLSDRDPQFLPQLFRLLFSGVSPKKIRRILFFVRAGSEFESYLRVIDEHGWQTVRDAPLSPLPVPSLQWQLKSRPA